MNWIKIQKILILLTFIIGAFPAANAQNGSITIDFSTFQFQSTAGNFPYLKYRVDPIRIFTKSGLQLAESSGPVQRFYLGDLPQTSHVYNIPMFSSLVINGSSIDNFNLQTTNSLLVEQQIYAGTVEPGFLSNIVGYTSPYHKIPLTYFAAAGENNHTRRRSITGEDSNGNNIPYPYHFSFISSYDLDAVQPNLEFYSMQDSVKSEFCEGEFFKIKASYKGPFHNGLFHWEVNYGSEWVFLRYDDESITQFAQNSGVRYRARLATEGGRYGVSNFSNPNRYAQTPVIPGTNSSILRVRHKINDFTFIRQDVCPVGELGKIRIASMSGAQIGANYTVNVNDENGDFIDNYTIENYEPNYFVNNNVAIGDLPIGNYEVSIIHDAANGSISCERKKAFSIDEYHLPTFSASTEHLRCFGDNGRIYFKDLRYEGYPAYPQTTMTAVDTSGAVFTKTLYGGDVYSASNRFLNVPVGEYTLSASHRLGCTYELPGTVTVTGNPELTATLAPLPEYDVNGTIYNGVCAASLVTGDFTVEGGVPPYTIFTSATPPNVRNFGVKLSPNDNNIQFSLKHGTYVFKIRDAVGCRLDPITVTINNPPLVNFPTFMTSPPTVACNGFQQDGSITEMGEVSGGFPPYTFYADGVEVSDFNIEGLGNSTTTLSVVDSLGCTTSEKVTISDFNFMQVFEEFSEEILPCVGTIPGQLFVNGGDPIDATGYTLTINGVPCEDIPNCQMLDFINGTNPSAEFSFEIDTSALQIFEISDSLGCVVSKSAQFPEALTPEVSGVSVIPPACSGGDYEVSFFLKNVQELYGSPVSLMYSLDNGTIEFISLNTDSLGTFLEPYQFTTMISGLGGHSIVISTNNGCESQKDFSLEGVDMLSLNLLEIQNTTCHADTTGSINFSLTGDTPYTVELFKDGSRTDSITLNQEEHTFRDLLPGSFKITVIDGKGCTTADSNILITNPDILQTTANSTSQIDCTGNNGIIEMTGLAGGTGPFEYSLNNQPFQSSPILTGALLENIIIVRDANNCGISLDYSIPLAGPTIFPSMSQFLPATECDLGKAILEVQAGFTTPLTIQKIANPTNFISDSRTASGGSVSTNIFRDTFENLEVGTHYFLIQDDLGCEGIDSVEITSIAPLVASISTKTPESCYQQSADGSITISTSGGTAPYTISTNGETPITTSGMYTYTDLAYGLHEFSIIDSRGCTMNLIDSVQTISLPVAMSTISNYQGCIGEDLNATVLVTGTHGTAPFTYEWSDGSTDALRMLPADAYVITITDANGCTSEDGVYVNLFDTLDVMTNATMDVTCQADMNGTISVSPNGGFAPYTFSIDGGNTFQTDSTLTNLGVGDYEVLVKDDHDCLDTTFATIEATNPLAGSAQTTNVLCNAEANGSLEITLIDGVAPFTYSIDGVNFQAQNIFNNLSPGNYTAWIQDGSGCLAAYDNHVVMEPVELTLATNLLADETCGENNGSVQGIPSGGTAPYTYEWDGNPALNQATLSNASAGLHTLMITDANSCTKMSSLTIADLEAPSLSLENSQEEFCGMANGVIDLNVSNGTTPFIFNWSHDAGLNDSTATNLSAANYSVTITDANMCSDVLSFSINEVAAPSLSEASSTNSLCSNDNGEIVLSLADGTAPFTYSWSHDLSLNSNIASGLQGGNYTTTVTDANGCSDEISVSIDFNIAPAFQNAIILNSFCNSPNGNIELTTTGGTAPLTYTWSHDASLNNAIATNLLGGLYDVTVTDANGCQDIITDMNVNSVSVPALAVTAFNNADCLNPMGDITIEVTGGVGPFTYAWSHDAMETGTTVSGLTSGTYTATVTDANGCQDIISQSLISFVGSSEITSTLDCFGDTNGSIELSLEGNLNDYQYDWSDASIPAGPAANNLGGGIYSVTVTNMNGCTEVFIEDIIEPALLESTISDIVPVGCDGNLGSAVVNPTGGTAPYVYLWDDGNAQTTAIATDLEVGNYEVLITDANACTTLGSVEVLQSSDIELSETALINPLCFGDETGSIEILATGGTFPYTFIWDDPMGQTTETASGLEAGIYTLLVTDAVGCTQVYSSEIVQPDALEIIEIDVQQPACFNDENGNITITANGGAGVYEYVWNGGSLPDNNMISNLGSGMFDLQIIDANGCTISESVELFNPDELVIIDSVVDPVSCNSVPNGSIEIAAEGGDQNLSYTWSNGTSDSNLENLNPGFFQLSITDGQGCELITSYEITSIDGDYIDLGNSDTTVCKGEALYYDFTATTFETFRWTSQQEGELSTNPIFATTDEDTYFFYAIRNDGCIVEDTIEVNYTAEFLNAFFIAPTDIVVGDTIVALEVSLPIPDRVEWNYDTDHVEAIGQDGNQFLFAFDTVGEYDLTLTSFSGDCSNDITKTIFVYADSTELPFINPLVPTIVDIKLFPNPTDGIFTISVELSDELDMAIDIFSSESILYDRALFSGSDAYSKDYVLDLPKGIYYAVIQVAGAKRTVTLVVD